VLGLPRHVLTMSDPRTAVVIATRNRSARLRPTLQHLLALPERPAVVVTDNASIDGTAAMVRTEFPGVQLIELAENRGAAARNVGTERATAPYVAFADDDSWYAPGALNCAAELFDRHPRLAVIAALVRVGPAEDVDPTCRAMTDSPLGWPADLPGPAVLGFLACGAIVRRSAFLSVGGFSDLFGVGGEEALLAIDLAAVGWGLAYVPAVVAYHHPPPRFAGDDRRRIQVRNAIWCAWLRRRPVGAVRRTIRLLRGACRDRQARAGVVASLAAFPAIFRARRPVPAWLDRELDRLDA
jgi:N-acetylglucosaminyl-diphospho-decaprenol L-rhamnosyltransferase